VAKIVVIDDEPVVRHMLRLGLVGHEVLAAANGLEGLLMATRNKPDLIILDIKMPGIDGYEVCRRLRVDPELADIPIIFASSQDTLPDKLTGFDAGADDYMTKPFDLTELQFRIKAILRRSQPKEPETNLAVGEVRLNLLSREATTAKGTLILTPTEFTLLEYLMRRPGVLLPISQILEEVWRYPPGVGDPTLVRMHIRHLREKLEANPAKPQFIQTVGRQGYTIRG